MCKSRKIQFGCAAFSLKIQTEVLQINRVNYEVMNNFMVECKGSTMTDDANSDAIVSMTAQMDIILTMNAITGPFGSLQYMNEMNK